jgi:CRISPR-associated protein Cas8b1/Cst1 subtype I-B
MDDIPDVDHDTLMMLLKEKAKELKSTQKKLSKVEDKFVELHKAQKNLIDDRDVLLQFLQLVFPSKILEEEIMIMPEGPQGYGMLDYNSLRQFWSIHQQNRDNEKLQILGAIQEEKKILTEKLRASQTRQNQGEQTTSEIQKKVNNLLEQNDWLKEKIQDFNNEDKIKSMRNEIEQKYIS